VIRKRIASGVVPYAGRRGEDSAISTGVSNTSSTKGLRNTGRSASLVGVMRGDVDAWDIRMLYMRHPGETKSMHAA
jgi:hypothetical protein